MKCCKTLVDGEIETLPFDRVIALGYYDGPTEGFTECSQCGDAYYFRKLDWDDMQDMRIFAFSPLSVKLDTIAGRLLSDSEKDTRFSILKALSYDDEKFVKEHINQPVTRIAAFEGWPGHSSIWRDVSGIDLTRISDWFTFLGIKRKKCSL